MRALWAVHVVLISPVQLIKLCSACSIQSSTHKIVLCLQHPELSVLWPAPVSTGHVPPAACQFLWLSALWTLQYCAAWQIEDKTQDHLAECPGQTVWHAEAIPCVTIHFSFDVAQDSRACSSCALMPQSWPQGYHALAWHPQQAVLFHALLPASLSVAY